MAEEQAIPRILVVDDDPMILTLIEELLKRGQMKPILAETAMEAADILKNQPLPDLMVLDLMLPEISGIDFLKQMRSKPAYRDLPVVILSALAEPDDIRRGLAAGADRYLTKPYLAVNLVKTVREVLATGRITEE